MATKKKYEVGKEIEAYCTKCKIDRLAVIETLKSDGNINRVICRTCDGSHLFRRPKGDGTKPPSKRRKKGSVIVTEEELKKAKAYGFDTVYGIGDIITHPTFGPGSVVLVKSDGKMEVGFEMGAKLLVCGIPPVPTSGRK
jgi:hypothetical protein